MSTPGVKNVPFLTPGVDMGILERYQILFPLILCNLIKRLKFQIVVVELVVVLHDVLDKHVVVVV